MPSPRRTRRLLVTVLAVLAALAVPTVVAAAGGDPGPLDDDRGSSSPERAHVAAPTPDAADAADESAGDGASDDESGTQDSAAPGSDAAEPTVTDATTADADDGSGSAVATAPADAKPDTRPDVRPDREPPHVRFACELRRTDTGPAIECKWSEAPADRVAGYRLWRAVDDRAREVIHETRDLRENGYVDRAVRPGHLYHYAVQYLGADGEVLVTSHAERIRVPAPEPAHIRLACATSEHDGVHGGVVTCKWSQPDVRVAGYELVRRDAEGRDVVARVGADVHAHRERVRPGRYQYRVYGIDAHGRIVAVSPGVGVHVPHDRPTDAADGTTDEPATDRPAAAG